MNAPDWLTLGDLDAAAPADALDSMTAPGLPPPPAQRPAASHQRAVRVLVTRWMFGTAALLGAIGALLFAFLPPDLAAPARAFIAASFAVFAVLSAAATRVPPQHTEGAMLLLVLAGVAVIGAASWLLGWGLAAPGLGFFALLVCLACALGSRRSGVVAAGFAAAVLLVLAAAPGPHGLPAGAELGAMQLGLRLTIHVLLLVAGLAGGWMLADVLARHARLAAEREQRFAGLLSIAADAYWELDPQYRLVSATLPREAGLSLDAGNNLGDVPWDLPQFGCDAETLDQLQADLQARHPLRDLPVTWRDRPDHAVRHLLVSGEPRFDARGVFLGYWGVARDVTADHEARVALVATETRYQDLFARIPTPLVLHRRGRVLDVNPAALALFGHTDLDNMVGGELLGYYDSGDSRERLRRRIEQLETMPLGEALPVTEYRLRSRSGGRIVARATGVRVVDSDGEPATLSIYVDDSERRAAEDAVRRSETMLSHLVASSPDAITLTELDSGRYTMVNQAFERTLGWRAAEVVGRSSVELGIWRRPQDRERLVAELRTHGRVTDMAAEFVTRSGQPVSMRVSGARFTLARREYLVINARDVSAAERARLEREAILENTTLGIAVTRERRFVMANPAFEQMFGWPPGMLVGEPGQVVWASEEDYAEIGRTVGPALARGEAVEIDRRSRRRDGSSFLARIVGKAIDPSHPAKGGTIWIVEDVTERRQVAEALARARDDAEAASRAKSAFLANTSHELRTPLNGMLGLAQLARASDIDEERRRQYLDQIVESALSLAEILSDILDLAKIEAGKMQMHSQPFEPVELLQALRRAYAALAQARGLTLTLEPGEGLAGQVLGDALRVRQILGNYLSNALKFSAQGSVRLLARRLDDTRVRFEVHDSGPGIEEAVQQRLFEPFTQADESTTRRFGGTGLGLSICRELAHMMKGEVGVISRPGTGSCFWAELPLPPLSGGPAVAAAAQPAAPAALRGARVLLAEDNPVNMMIGVAMLERWGLQVEQAHDGRQAVQLARDAARAGQPFDAVLMDLQMPVMSGYEATLELRKQFSAEVLPIVALTAAALVTEREQALGAGMSDFLTKPIDSEKLRAVLARVLGDAADRPRSER
jgi:PAS domain S-box-containing protein